MSSTHTQKEHLAQTHQDLNVQYNIKMNKAGTQDKNLAKIITDSQGLPDHKVSPETQTMTKTTVSISHKAHHMTKTLRLINRIKEINTLRNDLYLQEEMRADRIPV